MKIEKKKKKKDEKSRREEHDESEHMPALPFPQKLYREKLDKQFGIFLDVLKQVHVNLPFTEVLSQMPAYAKFLKEILTKKRKIEETSVIKLTEHCNAILQNKLPQKCGDLGNILVVNMEGKKEVPLIIGRPFLAMGREILDIHERKLMLRVGEETVTFDMNVEKRAQKDKVATSVE
ncbi:uncharacterized protein [Nicotiana tomentosiformis]|uniref:uncharacterized protein n=1 Tax=Nicotiana tomentosiformis TaxID=4098 RepID=UPI00388C9A84